MAAALEYKYVIRQFDGDNFNTWFYLLKTILNEQECVNAILETEFATNPENKKMKARVRSILDSAHRIYSEWGHGIQNASKSGRELYETKYSESNVLRRQLSDMKYNEKVKVQTHFTQMEEVFTQLKNATVFSEEEKINHLLLVVIQNEEVFSV